MIWKRDGTLYQDMMRIKFNPYSIGEQSFVLWVQYVDFYCATDKYLSCMLNEIVYIEGSGGIRMWSLCYCVCQWPPVVFCPVTHSTMMKVMLINMKIKPSNTNIAAWKTRHEVSSCTAIQ